MAIKYGMAEEEGLTTHICPDGFEDRVDMKVAELRGDGDEWKGWWRPAMEDPRMSSPHETPPYLRGAKYTPDFYGIERDWAWMIFPWNVTEDLVNIVRKIKGEKPLAPAELRTTMKKNFNVTVSAEQLQELLEHIRYLDHG